LALTSCSVVIFFVCVAPLLSRRLFLRFALASVGRLRSSATPSAFKEGLFEVSVLYLLIFTYHLLPFKASNSYSTANVKAGCKKIVKQYNHCNNLSDCADIESSAKNTHKNRYLFDLSSFTSMSRSSSAEQVWQIRLHAQATHISN